MNELILIALLIASIPAIWFIISSTFMIIFSFSDLWVTNETIQAGMTDYFYLCALLESISDKPNEVITNV